MKTLKQAIKEDADSIDETMVDIDLAVEIVKEWLTQKRQEPDWIKQEVIDELLEELE